MGWVGRFPLVSDSLIFDQDNWLCVKGGWFVIHGGECGGKIMESVVMIDVVCAR